MKNLIYQTKWTVHYWSGFLPTAVLWYSEILSEIFFACSGPHLFFKVHFRVSHVVRICFVVNCPSKIQNLKFDAKDTFYNFLTFFYFKKSGTRTYIFSNKQFAHIKYWRISVELVPFRKFVKFGNNVKIIHSSCMTHGAWIANSRLSFQLNIDPKKEKIQENGTSLRCEHMHFILWSSS